MFLHISSNFPNHVILWNCNIGILIDFDWRQNLRQSCVYITLCNANAMSSFLSFPFSSPFRQPPLSLSFFLSLSLFQYVSARSRSLSCTHFHYLFLCLHRDSSSQLIYIYIQTRASRALDNGWVHMYSIEISSAHHAYLPLPYRGTTLLQAGQMPPSWCKSHEKAWWIGLWSSYVQHYSGSSDKSD